ncbi:endonuclease/exonuclease/phosphatase family metal-dependent hydrolase [Salinibacter ruber]|uniref:endonuclease/exonuclease/phosphatase family protein n=1 Tax=Salinibacter ruber TaxID=146919 RepID=UPI0013C2E72D|nr:endonuclease/exonuclease/phosphatase family protein [Salinibacter ruber]MCS3671185.1 endonuclease/exonuclease/phosphatase family metal-dependent hydrolase [Salinibacter ruber]MCS4049046.1 endonuclease/exonuclease/phosphatase family metal-dependent hydrolase [Salinibacter ruber]MCS4101024.1 endonuclease/exonuclease/phosphatase family metal-dependent hydrolase [Salinibacter ruber]
MGLQRALQGLAWSGAGLLVAAFLMGYAAPYLPPARFWWTDLFAVLLPALAGAVGLLGIGLVGQGAYSGRWGRLGIGGALLLLVALRFGTVPTGEASGRDADALRVMTFNLSPAFARGPDRERTLAELVQREAPAVLSVQETWMKTRSASDGGGLFVSWPLRVLLEDSVGYALPRARPPETTIYRPVLGQVRLDSMRVHPLPPSGGSDPRSRYARTFFTWQGRPAVLYNVHLHTVGTRPWDLPGTAASLARWRTFLRTYRAGALHRADQARRIHRHIEQETRPVLVTGDFNSTPHQWAYRHLLQGLRAAAPPFRPGGPSYRSTMSWSGRSGVSARPPFRGWRPRTSCRTTVPSSPGSGGGTATRSRRSGGAICCRGPSPPARWRGGCRRPR